MVRIRYWVYLMAFTGLLGCSADCDEAAQSALQQTPSGYAEGSWRARYLELGRETYHQACAACHQDGKDDAPIKGKPETWTNRSPLWSAVLLEHAKNGYLSMPAKGGQVDLSDKAVAAAGEYMLNETYPELPRD